MRIQLWPPAEAMLSSTLQFHCREAHGYWTGDIRDIRALRRHHAQMHETEWANPDTTPHTHQAGRTGLSWAEVTEAEDG